MLTSTLGSFGRKLPLERPSQRSTASLSEVGF